MKALEMVKRNIVINDTQTTIVLERIYWAILQIAADRGKITWQQMCQVILRKQPSSYKSRSGYLRFYCTAMLHDQLQKVSRARGAVSTQ